MPIGSLAIGYAAQAWGTLNAALLPAIGMGATVLFVHLTSDFWRLGPVPVRSVIDPIEATVSAG
jgi:hypothetical protein